MSTYEREILMILREAGPNGLPLRRIVLNVYNMTNTLFEQRSREDIYQDVGAYLRAASEQKGGTVVKASTRGWYRLNPRSNIVQQMLFDFQVKEEDEWML